MENSTKFSLTIDKINLKIAELNIKISQDSNNDSLKEQLNNLLIDRNMLYTGNRQQLEKIIEKYGENK